MELILRLAVVAGVGLAAWLISVSARRWFGNPSLPEYFDPKDAGLGDSRPALIGFSTRYCYECQVALPVLTAASVEHGMPLAVIDARDRPDLALKYSIRSTPTILLVDQRGRVAKGWFETPEASDLRTAASALVA